MKTVAEVARLFDVDRDIVKRWCHAFSSYLSTSAHPPSGNTRYFTDDDIRVLAVVYYYWEDEPDYEAINYRLNSGYQNSEEYLEFAYLNNPIFRDPPEDVEEKSEHSVMLAGEYYPTNQIDVARAYKKAGDALIAQALGFNYYPYEIDYPILFLYRHSTEVYLKILAGFDFGSEREHNLAKLLNRVEARNSQPLPAWMRARLLEIDAIDAKGESFRYSQSIPPELRDQSIWIDLYQLKTVMRVICDAFEKAIGLPYA